MKEHGILGAELLHRVSSIGAEAMTIFLVCRHVYFVTMLAGPAS
jgi:hypothetical protein